MLRAQGCEKFQHQQKSKHSLTSQIILNLWNNEVSFRDWCSKTLFIPELAYILKEISETTERVPYKIKDILAKCVPHATIISGDISNNSLEDQDIYICSANSNKRIGSKFMRDDPPISQGPLPLRLIGLSKKLTSELRQGKSADTPSSDSESNSLEIVTENEKNTPIDIIPTSLDLGRKSLKSQIVLVEGEGQLEESLACFKMMADALELPYRRDAIEKTLRDALRRGQQPSLPMLGQLAADMGLHVVGAKVTSKSCTRLNVPFLMSWDNSFALAVNSDESGLLIAHPRLGWLNLTPETIIDAYPDTFDLLLVDRTSETLNQKFNFSWFLPALQRYQRSLLQVLLASFVVQLFTLANPLLIQVIIDKVISQRSLDTLQILGFALVVVTILEGVLGSLRTFLFADTTNRIDMRLGAEVIDHLLRLPVGYFDRRPVGDLGTRIAELEKIRNFLTGQALTTILDAAYSVIYILVMALYSWVLTLVALIVVPIQVALTILGAPLFRRQFRQAAEENARTQAHLVETLTGIQTVKAQNVEIVSRWKWQERYSRYVSRTFEKTITGTALLQTGQVLQKLSQLMVLWVGATLVLKGELTLGQLIAFRIISGYVTQLSLDYPTFGKTFKSLK